MKKLYIIKVGTTFPATEKQFGDFDKWTETTLGILDIEIVVVDAEHGDSLPIADRCAGVVITGSHSMVTDDLPWSVKLEEWIQALLKVHIPLFGICYGHQLLARAAGGQVGFHPLGKEIGTVGIKLLSDCANDLLFKSLPKSFSVHVTHAQTVLALPTGATCLAGNTFEPNHAFRIGNWAWGVQFHPEYSADIMRSYIEQQADELVSAGQSVPKLLCAVVETPVAAQTLRNFGYLVKRRMANKAVAQDRNSLRRAWGL